jgi:hypothetical protein
MEYPGHEVCTYADHPTNCCMHNVYIYVTCIRSKLFIIHGIEKAKNNYYIRLSIYNLIKNVYVYIYIFGYI